MTSYTDAPAGGNPGEDINPDPGAIGDAIRRRLELSPWVELRFIDPDGGPPSNYWVGRGDDIAAATGHAVAANKLGRGVYATFNVLDAKSPGYAKDGDISGRSMLFIDIDPEVEPKGRAATDAERVQAGAVAVVVAAELESRVWGRPAWFHDTGNGRALYYPCEPGVSATAVNALLHALHARHGTAGAKVDAAVSNPARISRLAGTVNTKGGGRRLCRVVAGDPDPVTVTAQMVADAGGVEHPDRPDFADPRPPADAGLPGADFNRRADWWADILTPAGAKAAGRVGEVGHVTRPGKSAGTSATLGHFRAADGSPALFVFSSNWPGLEPGKCYDKFGAFARLFHRGDFKAAARDLSAKGYGTAKPGARADFGAGSPGGPTPCGWTPPYPIGSHGPPPPFPTHELPGWWGDFARDLAESTQTPPDCAAALTLAAVCGSLAGRFKYTIRPGFTKNANVFTTVAMESGERKSAVFRAAFAPVRDAEAAARKSAGPDIARKKADKDTLESRLRHLQGRAAKSDDPAERSELGAQVRELAAEVEAFVVPPTPQFVADDATAEALAKTLIEQGGRLVQAGAEGTCFKVAAGRYSERENFDVYLKGHDGDPLIIDRVGRGNSSAEEPRLTCGVALQPSVLREMGASAAARHEGFLARWLVFAPEPRVGSRKIGPPPVPPAVSARYARVLGSLWSAPLPAEPAEVRFDAAADAAMAAFEWWVEPQLAPEGELSGIAGWGNKLAGEVARLAGAIHLADAAGEGRVESAGPVGREPVDAAVRIAVGCLIPHAKAAFGMMLGDPAEPLARRVLKRLAKTGVASATKRDLFQVLKGGGSGLKADDLDPALALLCEHNYLRPTDDAPRPGRPAERYEVNPLWDRGGPPPESPKTYDGGRVSGDSGEVFDAAHAENPAADPVSGDSGEVFGGSAARTGPVTFEPDDRPEACR